MSTVVFLLFSFPLSGGAAFFLLVFGVALFSCFFLLGALCFLSLSFHYLNKPLEIDPMFLA